jgi:hypothetical protein
MAARRTGSVGREPSRGDAGVWQWGHAALVGATLLALALGAHDGRRWTSGGAAVSSAEVVALPVPVLTPGAVDPVTAEELCSGAPRPAPQVPIAVRQQVLRAYRAETVPADAYELDYLITPELGGAGDPRNLWPQLYASAVWNAYVKDELEDLLPRLVCSGAVALADAQRDIARNWIAAYKKYFQTDRPLPQQTVRGQKERNR